MKNTLNYQHLEQLLKRYGRPSEALLARLYPEIQARSYDQREIFAHQGDRQPAIALILEGAAIGVRRDRLEQKLHQLWGPKDLIINPQSSLSKERSPIEIHFVCPSRTLEISVTTLDKLRQEYAEMTHYVDLMLTAEIQRQAEHIRWLKETETRQRIIDFENRYPQHLPYLSIELKVYYLQMSKRWYQMVVNGK